MLSLQKHQGSSKKNVLTIVASAVEASEYHQGRLEQYLKDVQGALDHEPTLSEVGKLIDEDVTLSVAFISRVTESLRKQADMQGSVRLSVLESIQQCILKMVHELGIRASKQAAMSPDMAKCLDEMYSEALIVYPLDSEIPQFQSELANTMNRNAKTVAASKFKALCKKVVASKAREGASTIVWQLLPAIAASSGPASTGAQLSQEDAAVIEQALLLCLEALSEKLQKAEAAVNSEELDHAQAAIGHMVTALGEQGLEAELAESAIAVHKLSWERLQSTPSGQLRSKSLDKKLLQVCQEERAATLKLEQLMSPLSNKKDELATLKACFLSATQSTLEQFLKECSSPLLSELQELIDTVETQGAQVVGDQEKFVGMDYDAVLAHYEKTLMQVCPTDLGAWSADLTEVCSMSCNESLGWSQNKGQMRTAGCLQFYRNVSEGCLGGGGG